MVRASAVARLNVPAHCRRSPGPSPRDLIAQCNDCTMQSHHSAITLFPHTRPLRWASAHLGRARPSIRPLPAQVVPGPAPAYHSPPLALPAPLRARRRPAHCPHPALAPSPGAGPGTQDPDPSSLPVFLLPRGKSPSPPPPPHFCYRTRCTAPHLHLLASGHRPLPSPPAPARSPVATHLFVLSALAGDVSFQFIPPLRSVLPTFRQAGKLESWKVGKHTTRAVREDPSHRQPTAGARARPPASPHSPSIHPRSPVTYRSSSSHPRLRLTRRVNRQTLRPLLTSATHPCPARAPGESSTCPRSPAPPSSPLHLAPAHLGQPASKPGPRSGASPLCCFGSPAPLAAFAARADPSVRRRTWRRPLPSTSTRGEQYLPAGRRHPRSPPSPRR